MKKAKCPYFFLFMALELSYGHILISMPPCRWIARLEMRKTEYLSSRAMNQKIKALCFLQLLKLWKAKCLYFFDLWPLCWVIAIWRSTQKSIKMPKKCKYWHEKCYVEKQFWALIFMAFYFTITIDTHKLRAEIFCAIWEILGHPNMGPYLWWF